VNGILVALLTLFFLAGPASVSAQARVRPYPDPGHRWLGVYGGGDERYFDYALVKISLGDTFPKKAEWWAGLKASRQGRADAHRHDIYIVYCGERDADLDGARKRLDAWLKPQRDCPTYPELIPVICLGEENIPARNAVLDGLARHIREQYGIPVFQWYSDPLPPDPNLAADGWIFDAYGWSNLRFRKHLMKFVALGKPVICVPWATDPHWPQWKQYRTTEALIDSEWHQFDACREFNVSCAAFAVAGPTGSVNHWIGSSTREMVKLRNALRLRREIMHGTRSGESTLVSANFSARDRSVQVGGDPGEPSLYEEPFSGFGWLHDADVRGFLDLRTSSFPDKPGLLLTRTRPGKEVQASLVYRFESYFPLDSVEVTLDALAPKAARCRNSLAVTTDELDKVWPLEATPQGTDRMEPLVLKDKDKLKGHRVFYVRILMENHADRANLPGNQLDRLCVRCVHQVPGPGATATLTADDYGNLTYEDDYRTQRWQHLGRLEVGHTTHGGYREGGFWVGRKGGYATAVRLVQRISSPKPLASLAVTANGFADGKNLGGGITLQIVSRAGKVQWETSSRVVHNGPLRLEVPGTELRGMKEFDVHVVLSSSSGVEGGDSACATLNGLSIQAK